MLDLSSYARGINLRQLRIRRNRQRLIRWRKRIDQTMAACKMMAVIAVKPNFFEASAQVKTNRGYIAQKASQNPKEYPDQLKYAYNSNK